MRIKQMITTVDTHTEGGPTRIVTSGIPPLKGTSMGEKRDYFKTRHDEIRTCLMNHPRGYQGMFGAILTEPTDPNADIGVFFITNTGYLDMCVHSAIGVAAACLETGMIHPNGEEGLVRLETPAGLISLWAKYSGNDLISLSIEPTPSFVQTQSLVLDIGMDTPVTASVVFSAVFFVLIDVGRLGITVTQDEEEKLRKLACSAIEKSNQVINTDALEKTENRTVDLAFLYENLDSTACKSAVFSKTGILDKSPCGAGTAAKMTLMHQSGELDLNTDFTNGNMFNTNFRGRLTQSKKNGQVEMVQSIISGEAHITGFHKFIIDFSDTLNV
jgi:proline racemase